MCARVAYGPRMTGSAWLFLALAGVAAPADWSAVARKDKRIEYVAKPATLCALILVAVALDPEIDAMRVWFVVGLALSLVGDVFLMLPGNLFVQGLGSFLLAHLAYIAGFAAGGTEESTLLIAAPVVAVAVLVYARLLIKGMTGEERAMKLPVALYAVAIGTMLVMAIASHLACAILGAGLFVISDGLIGYSRFLRMTSWAPLAIIVTYHLGQAGLVLSLVFA